MNIRTLFALPIVLGALASCAQLDPHPMDMTGAIRNAQTPADHDAVARHY